MFKIDKAGFYKNRWGNKIQIKRCPSSGLWKDNTGRVFDLYGYNALDSSYDIIAHWEEPSTKKHSGAHGVQPLELEEFEINNMVDEAAIAAKQQAVNFWDKAIKQNSNKFYLIFNPQQSAPKHRHYTLEESQKEARRIAKRHPEQTVYVLETVACYTAEVEIKEIEI